MPPEGVPWDFFSYSGFWACHADLPFETANHSTKYEFLLNLVPVEKIKTRTGWGPHMHIVFLPFYRISDI